LSNDTIGSESMAANINRTREHMAPLINKSFLL
jgi:hypothetical protein